MSLVLPQSNDNHNVCELAPPKASLCNARNLFCINDPYCTVERMKDGMANRDALLEVQVSPRVNMRFPLPTILNYWARTIVIRAWRLLSVS